MNTATIHVVTIEDDARYRASLGTLFRSTNDFSVISSFSSAEPALAYFEDRRLRPAAPICNLVLMDIHLPGMSGIEATRQLKIISPHTSVVALTVFDSSSTIVHAICAGADGYVLKRTQPAVLLAELRSVVRGGAPLSSDVARTVLDFVRETAHGPKTGSSLADPSALNLTRREQQVLACLVDGRSYKQIAGHLNISIDTVRTHIRGVYSKLQVHSVAEAVSRALRTGLI